MSLSLFVGLISLMGGMFVPFVIWIFTATLVPDVLTWPMILLGLGAGAWLGRLISQDWEWFQEEE